MKDKYNTDMILCYNSRNRYKVCFNQKKQVIELYHLDNNTLWERFDYFKCDNMSKNEIIQKSKELIHLWKSEPANEFHHATELT